MEQNNKPENPQAFPALDMNVYHESGAERLELRYKGMTLRDYFAAKAMQGWIENEGSFTYHEHAKIAQLSYEMADAMLTERQKDK